MNGFSRRVRFAIAATLLLGAAALPGGAPAADAPIEMNAIISTTGYAAIAGIPALKGLKALEDMVNAGGGTRGGRSNSSLPMIRRARRSTCN